VAFFESYLRRGPVVASAASGPKSVVAAR